MNLMNTARQTSLLLATYDTEWIISRFQWPRTYQDNKPKVNKSQMVCKINPGRKKRK